MIQDSKLISTTWHHFAILRMKQRAMPTASCLIFLNHHALIVIVAYWGIILAYFLLILRCQRILNASSVNKGAPETRGGEDYPEDTLR